VTKQTQNHRKPKLTFLAFAQQLIEILLFRGGRLVEPGQHVAHVSQGVVRVELDRPRAGHGPLRVQRRTSGRRCARDSPRQSVDEAAHGGAATRRDVLVQRVAAIMGGVLDLRGSALNGTLKYFTNGKISKIMRILLKAAAFSE